eukprot:gnl/TRDRNA2_/TRDRNA2_184266_c0_seq1.p1 gnl/TRDRNA2_/TRDRNA2_184266_c0~~gnl/TRDRNA2_/TRDRNA2_184266_c0_seq1.p1  ORF type:complete len:190 (-),score=28.23 gnl/TRDRNA2_/TRDRNA2_184266_c0_seq1:71-601(-)
MGALHPAAEHACAWEEPAMVSSASSATEAMHWHPQATHCSAIAAQLQHIPRAPRSTPLGTSFADAAGPPAPPAAGAVSGPGGSLGAEDLRLLTQWRQQYRRTINGYLCAAAGVKDGVAFTGCTNMPNDDGEGGREWCYLDSDLLQDLPPGAKRWGYCAPPLDLDAMRRQKKGICGA